MSHTKLKTKTPATRDALLGGADGVERDVTEFLASVKKFSDVDFNRQSLFEKGRDVFVARAPGRLDVMGGIADYSGSLVLQMPLAEATFAGVQLDTDSCAVQAFSLVDKATSSIDEAQSFVVNLDGLEGLRSYTEAREMLAQGADAWAAYVVGALIVLRFERGASFKHGARILISSRVPQGKGVSSSAALEVAAMTAICGAFDINIEPRELALLCQTVENEIVGAPCGVMDQMTATCGVSNHLLKLLCQPAEIQGYAKLPDELAVWGIDSGARHSISGGSDYATVRAASLIGYRICANLLASSHGIYDDEERALELARRKWSGYLANIQPPEFEASYAANLKQVMTGAEFFKRYKTITDTVTQVEPDKEYRVFDSTAHPVYEHHRVQTFASLLEAKNSVRRNELLGELMYQSHASYGRCGLGSKETDLIVNLVRENRSGKLYGAKITGGGSGGTVAILGARAAEAEVENLAAQFADITNHRPYIFKGSSAGSAAFGCLHVSL